MPCERVNLQRASQILDVAEHHIENYGLLSFNVSSVIAESNQSTTTFYKRFKGKEDLLVCLFLRNATSNHFAAIEAQYPNMTLIERFLLPIVLSFEMAHKYPAFLLVRQVSVNSRVWKMADERKVRLFKQKIDNFWRYINQGIRDLVSNGDLVASDEEILYLTQSVTFFLSGCLNALECGLIDTQFIDEERTKVFNQLTHLFKGYQWNSEVSYSAFEKMGMRCYMYLNQLEQQQQDKCLYCLQHATG
ncbi:TetR/AcrR family transcriptional regulator [Ferrimonas senticii]|uniref:TetR/AcrR family transcriptional regulator n=1 Tax=Ferrimonas senticii TaxID=394566 RepID=UPI00040CEEB6|nr:TetR/AcrR family transcriptional regulator [Ferrimonas senticii]